MTPQLQTVNWHRPARGEYGDCFRACLASIMDLPIAVVPHFAQGMTGCGAGRAEEMLARVREWLGPAQPFWFFTLAAETPEKARRVFSRFNPGYRYILIGGTRFKGVNHAVCCLGDSEEWNPSKTAQLVHPMWPDRRAFAAGVLAHV